MSTGKDRTKFVYYRYVNPITKKEVVDNVPLSDWEDIQNDRVRKNQFEFIRLVDLNKTENPDTPEKVLSDEGVKEEKKIGEIEIVDDELECPLCGYVAKTEVGLKSHKTKKHG